MLRPKCLEDFRRFNPWTGDIYNSAQSVPEDEFDDATESIPGAASYLLTGVSRPGKYHDTCQAIVEKILPQQYGKSAIIEIIEYYSWMNELTSNQE